MKGKISTRPPIKIKITLKNKVPKLQDKLNKSKKNFKFKNESQKLQVCSNEKTNSTEKDATVKNKVSNDCLV